MSKVRLLFRYHTTDSWVRFCSPGRYCHLRLSFFQEVKTLYRTSEFSASSCLSFNPNNGSFDVTITSCDERFILSSAPFSSGWSSSWAISTSPMDATRLEEWWVALRCEFRNSFLYVFQKWFMHRWRILLFKSSSESSLDTYHKGLQLRNISTSIITVNSSW